MVHRVEGLSGVHEEDEEVLIRVPLHRLVEDVVEVTDVVLEGPPRDEALLGPLQGVVEAGGDSQHHRLSDDAVVSVSDGDGAGVAGEQRAGLGDEEEETVVEAFRGEDPRREG